MSDSTPPRIPSRKSAGSHDSMDYHNRNLMSSLIIPQEVHLPPQPYERLPNIEFTMRGTLGVRLVDVLDPAFDGLDNPEFVPRMSWEAQVANFRLRWPGYSEWREAVRLYDRTDNMSPNTTRKIAQIVAQKIRVFYADLRNEDYVGNIDGWQLTNFPFEKLVLVELRHVSHGSWQPVLASLT